MVRYMIRGIRLTAVWVIYGYRRNIRTLMICLSKVKTKINNIEGVFMANATDNYKVINTKGLSIDEVVKQLHSQTGVKTEFNGKWLNSDMTEDDVYVALTGNTKAELEVMRKKHIEERKRKEREAKEKLPERIAEYKEKGNTCQVTKRYG